MIIQQISVFLENRPGTLAEVLQVLSEQQVNLRAMSLADTADFGILRLIVKDREKVEQVLRQAKFTVKTTPVLAMKIGDRPGGLLEKIQQLRAAGINIEYLYAFATAPGEQDARVVLKVDDLPRAESLCGGGVQAATADQEPDFYW